MRKTGHTTVYGEWLHCQYIKYNHISGTKFIYYAYAEQISWENDANLLLVTFGWYDYDWF